MTGQTCGFLCPMCECCDADIAGKDISHVLELVCCECKWAFAVEVS